MGTEAQGQDLATLAAVIADANFVERTTGGWVRKTLSDVQLAAFPAPDNVNNRYAVQVPSVTWTAPVAANNTVGLLLAYDSDTTVGTDANVVPVSFHDFIVNTDGNDVILNVGDFLRAA